MHAALRVRACGGAESTGASCHYAAVLQAALRVFPVRPSVRLARIRALKSKPKVVTKPKLV